MTDKELLELAAKAAGMEIHWPQEHWMDWKNPYCNGIIWNPLTDDGDAFRLSAKLKIDVDHKLGGYLGLDFIVSASYGSIYFEEDHEISPYESHRRAIVRAAAEIGKNMEAK